MHRYKTQYTPHGKYLWDAWFIEKAGRHHMFHLQTAASIDPTPAIRDASGVSIGHAISDDFRHWHELPTALTPGPAAAWDNANLWSGCVAEKDGQYYLYYTGLNAAPEHRHIQKICVATSPDLLTWKKHPHNPILEADERYYHHSSEPNGLGHIGAWRDPFVFKDPYSDRRYMTISARTKCDDTEYNGSVALAESEDMIHWTVHPPIFSPGVYDEIEVTRVIHHNGYYYLFFTTKAVNYEPSYAKKYGAHEGLHCYYSDNLFGGYLPVNGNGTVLDNGSEIYDIRVLHQQDNDFIGIGWLNRDTHNNFIGRLSEPMRIRIETDRVYRLDA